jgi:hypothetical protein
MRMDHRKGGWVVCERRAVSADKDKIFYLSRRFRTRKDALKERDRMGSLVEYENRNLGVTYWTDEPKGRRPIPSRRHPRR